ncbi:50S ribosomal protein L1 [Stratiformator vulcanicus]|uniref:Large ribosomal subunit protein uL1 n=1 Tax=Stratiformator vulcanicus TaxID=2527980 RepID=A0A517R0N0_9PLAN|nr:50S ribosomal protein L1 [Stratiformator vulcanicus]QDT37393.1 50S ribosomal protein L1 [Stratiformator vulcanicus]
MAKTSKRMKNLRQKAEEVGTVSLADAVSALLGLQGQLPKNVPPAKPDQVVELAVRLGIDAKQDEQRVRGAIVLPHGIGKSQRVIVFAQGDNVAVAEGAGADKVGGKELADEIKGGWLDFDVAIATPDMMGVVGPLGRVLGPRGLMPSPRAGTVTPNVADAVREYKAGKVEFKNDKGGVVHCVIGRMTFEPEQLVGNAEAILKHIESAKPSAQKGIYMRSVTVTATQMPGISVAL